jgi:hypothetical protein
MLPRNARRKQTRHTTLTKCVVVARIEYHDYNLFHQGGNGVPRLALKPDALEDFFVDHLSAHEHELARRVKSSELSEAAAREHVLRRANETLALCARPCVATAETAAGAAAGAAEADDDAPLVLLPFWGGAAEVDPTTGKVRAPRGAAAVVVVSGAVMGLLGHDTVVVVVVAPHGRRRFLVARNQLRSFVARRCPRARLVARRTGGWERALGRAARR